MSSNIKVIVFIVLFIAGAIGGFIYKVSNHNAEPELSALVYPNPKPLPDFQLETHKGESFDNDQLLGTWSVIFFGFTFCPDVCPTTMAALGQVAGNLDAKTANKVQFIFVSVDPERDTREKLAEYVPFFNESFIGLRTDDAKMLESFSRELGAVYMKVPFGDSYQMEHSARIFIVDPHGRRYGIFADHPTSPGTIDVPTITRDIHTLVKYK